MTFFFDRSVGIAVPKALQLLRLVTPIEYHQDHFAPDALDDAWLPEVGERGWTVIGHDHSYHLRSNELAALVQYDIGCFYLWGSEATRWDKMRCFARAYDRVVAADADTPKPFIYRVTRTGQLRSVPFKL